MSIATLFRWSGPRPVIVIVGCWGFLGATGIRAQYATPQISTTTQDFASVYDFQNLISFDRDRNISVDQRPRPEYGPIGYRFGDLQLLPSLALGAAYDDNVYSSETNKRSAAFYLVQPHAALEMGSQSEFAFADAQLSIKRYVNLGNEDENGWKISSGGHLDINDSLALDGQITDQRQYEEHDIVGTPEDAANPVAVSDPNGYFRVTYTGARFRNSIAFQAARFSYEDVSSFTGASIDEHYRDQDIYRALQRSEFGISPELAVLETLTLTKTNYDSKLELDDKNSHEARILLGVDYDLTNLIRGEVALGYINREYELNNFRSIKGAAALIKVDYFLSELTTLSLWGRRAADDAALIGVNGYFANSVNLQADHELLRNLILTGIVTYEYDEYIANGGRDRSVNETVRARYLMNHRLQVNMDIDHINRSTEKIDFAPNYGATRLLLTFTLQF